jgi:hypothetical protein
MTDRQLTTRDLAQTSDADDDAQDHSEPDPPDHDPLTESTGYRETRDESSGTSEPPARDESEKQHDDRSLSNEPAELADLHADLPSIEPAELEQKPQGTPSNLDRGPLLPDDQIERFTTRWQEIQASFVDQPRDSVEQADALVADLMQRLAASFSNERERLEAQWDRGNDVSTEDLRVALTRYRSFFDRLLSA